MAQLLRQWADQWLDRFRPFPPGVLVEVFPKQDRVAAGSVGSLIRLPFGQHPETGRWSCLLSSDGQATPDPWAVLSETSCVNPDGLCQNTGVNNTSVPEFCVPEPPQTIAPMVQGCALLWGLVTKASHIHHLRHTERLALLYTVGQSGDAGRSYLHQVIALCSNYDPRITERWIQRLEDGHRPIRCATLKDWLKDFLPGAQCPCIPKRANPSPFDLLVRAKPTMADPLPSTSDNLDPVWGEVAQDLFGEPRSSPEETH